LEVRAGDEHLVLDLGSGLRALGAALDQAPIRASLLVSHFHWDHLQGLPFFAPAWDCRSQLDFYGPRRSGQTLQEVLESQMAEPFFPVPFSSLRAALRFRAVVPGDTFPIGAVQVKVCALNHPGGALGYRLEHGGSSLVYASDFEHGPEADAALAEFARGADALVYDAMYTEAEYQGRSGPSRRGWGHATWESAVALARRAQVRQLFLFHHEPSRTDAQLDEIGLAAARAFGPPRVAREGERVELR
jgi:phosphoribosyl 1,2-cyclic phosphodiesterase